MYNASILAVSPIGHANRSHLLSAQALGNDDSASSRLLYNVLMLERWETHSDKHSLDGLKTVDTGYDGRMCKASSTTRRCYVRSVDLDSCKPSLVQPHLQVCVNR